MCWPDINSFAGCLSEIIEMGASVPKQLFHRQGVNIKQKVLKTDLTPAFLAKQILLKNFRDSAELGKAVFQKNQPILSNLAPQFAFLGLFEAHSRNFWPYKTTFQHKIKFFFQNNAIFGFFFIKISLFYGRH